MSNLNFGKKKAQFMRVVVSMFAFPVIAILTFLGVVPLDPWIGWAAIILFVISVIIYFTRFRNAKFGMKKGDEEKLD